MSDILMLLISTNHKTIHTIQPSLSAFINFSSDALNS